MEFRKFKPRAKRIIIVCLATMVALGMVVIGLPLLTFFGVLDAREDPYYQLTRWSMFVIIGLMFFAGGIHVGSDIERDD